MLDFDSFRGKKIAIAGFGKEGRAIFTMLTNAGVWADVLDRDQKIAADLDKGIIFFSGPAYLEHCADYDVIFRSPGIPVSDARLQKAIAKGAQVDSQTKFFLRQCPSEIVGVTGTKGKGTTATLIYDLLSAAGYATYLGGNIGVVPAEFLKELNADSKVVLELSSFQLQDIRRGPHIAVFLNFSPDHLDYHQNEAEYFEAKCQIFAGQSPLDYAVLNADSDAIAKIAAVGLKSRKVWFSTESLTEPGAYLRDGELFLAFDGQTFSICMQTDLQLRGLHNVQNILAACSAAACMGVPIGVMRKVVPKFMGLAHHRLEFIKKVKDIAFYNDSLATVPEATIAAIQAFAESKVLILGGADKGLSYDKLANVIAKNKIRAAVLIGSEAGKIKQALRKSDYKGPILDGGKSMEKIVKISAASAQPGDVVLLSPAAHSFDMFKNYEDRARQFVQAVRNL